MAGHRLFFRTFSPGGCQRFPQTGQAEYSKNTGDCNGPPGAAAAGSQNRHGGAFGTGLSLCYHMDCYGFGKEVRRMDRRLAIAALMIFTVFLGFGIIIPVLPMMVADIDRSVAEWHTGLLLSLYSLMSFLL